MFNHGKTGKLCKFRTRPYVVLLCHVILKAYLSAVGIFSVLLAKALQLASSIGIFILKLCYFISEDKFEHFDMYNL